MKVGPSVLFFLLSPLLVAAGDADSFSRQVRPFLARHCTLCHSAKAKVANLDLEQYRSSSRVFAHQELWEKVARKIRTGEMPPAGRPKPDPHEAAAVLEWLNRAWARFDANVRIDPGRVTARRLNRAEYNNTIRDLVGLDLRPADDFPADDTGYGFDNIADVLSLSPALMEKYLAAAVKITSAAIALPREYKVTIDRYRADRMPRLGPPGSLTVKHPVAVEADYEIRLGVAGRRLTEQDQMHIAALIDGQLIEKRDGVFGPNQPRNVTFRVRLKPGTHTIEAIFQDPAGAPIRQDSGVLIESIEVRGPYNPAPFVPPPSHRLLLVCGAWPGQYDEACLKRIVSEFARRAFRRPVSASEVERFYAYIRKAQTAGEPPEVGIRYALQAILVSPQFLFRIEQDPVPAGTAPHLINEFELASRLSYFLWSSMPDEELFQLAEKRQLRKAGVLEAQVRRMIQDPKFSSFVENFAGQWLQLRNLDEVKPAPEPFPNFDEELRQAMKKETQLFFEYVARQDRSILEFLDARYSFLNERLARHYGLEGVRGAEFRLVELASPQRGGLLTQASVLTVTSYPNRTSPVLRGKFLLENFLNAPPPPPPPDVPTLEESAKGVSGTLRQQLEKHRSNAMCASCHERMDTLGFGLENFDAIGAWREQDQGRTIDASGALPGGRKFASPAELKAILLSEKDDFAQCLTEKMLIYALGRGLSAQDRPIVRRITRALAADNYRYSRLVIEIVRSAPFQMRRSEAGKAKS